MIAEYNAETAESIADMMEAYYGMKRALDDILVATRGGGIAACSVLQESEIERRTSVALDVFNTKDVPAVPLDIREKTLLGDNEYIKRFEAELQENLEGIRS